MLKQCLFILSVIIAGCAQKPGSTADSAIPTPQISQQPEKINAIPVPQGFTRTEAPSGSFASWLRSLPLKKDKTVYLYNRTRKRNQSAQYAVVDMSTGDKDLQQCADVVMRLRAEYLFTEKKYDSISFTDYIGKMYKWQGGADRQRFDQYLETVFGWCGSASLEKQLKPVVNFKNMSIGDVLIKGGFPGHAVIVADMIVNKKGEKMFLLIQGYQPAQDMHVLVNPADPELKPWHGMDDYVGLINTPEWQFTRVQLRRW